MPSGVPAHGGKGREWTRAMRDRLRDLAAQGHTTAECGRIMGVSKNAICGQRRRIGLSVKGAPRPRTPPREWDTPERIELAIRMRNDGATPAAIRIQLATLPGPELPRARSISERLRLLGYPSRVRATQKRMSLKREAAGRAKAPNPLDAPAVPGKPKTAVRPSQAPQRGGRPCRFIFDNGPWMDREPLWCEGEAIEGSAYCAGHHRLCYVKERRDGQQEVRHEKSASA